MCARWIGLPAAEARFVRRPLLRHMGDLSFLSWALAAAALSGALVGRRPSLGRSLPPVRTATAADRSQLQRRPATPDSVHLLFVGVYEPGQVEAVTGQVWYGLFRTARGWLLDTVHVTVDSIHTPCRPSEWQPQAYPRVRVDRPDSPVLMVRGVAGLLPRVVATYVPREVRLYPGQDLGSFRSPREVREILAFGSAPFLPSRLNVVDRPAVRDYVLAVWSAARDTTQVIFGPAPIAWPPTLRWVGDVDGDGKVDLVLEPATGGEEPVAPELWLSSLAAGPELVHRITGNRTIYCD